MLFKYLGLRSGLFGDVFLSAACHDWKVNADTPMRGVHGGLFGDVFLSAACHDWKVNADTSMRGVRHDFNRCLISSADNPCSSKLKTSL